MSKLLRIQWHLRGVLGATCNNHCPWIPEVGCNNDLGFIFQSYHWYLKSLGTGPECVIFSITLKATKIANGICFKGVVYLTVKVLLFKCAGTFLFNKNLLEGMVSLGIASWINNNLLGLTFTTAFQGCQW